MAIDRLISKIKELQNPTCVGLDPRLDYIPDFIKDECFQTSGFTPKGAAEAIYSFNKYIIDEIYDVVPAVKPQVAMYEQFGWEGFKAYNDTIEYARQKGLVIIGDIKRSDIASTAQAYSDGHIGRVAVGEARHEIYREDFITLNPYLGYDSIEPYVDNCKKFQKGLFILVKTSNPNSGEIQDLISGGKKIYEHVGSLVSQWGQSLIGEYGFSQIGAVVGATHSKQAEELRKLMPHTFFLVPGYGAQGGTAEELSVCFNGDGLGAIVNSSRGIIAAHRQEAYKKHFSEREFAKAARKAALDMKADLERVIL